MAKKQSDKIVVKLKKLHPDAVIPEYAHDGDVCMDMTAISMDYDVENDMYIYHTGLAFESEKNIGQFLFLRSSNCKTDAYLCNGVGVADSPIYRGEIQFRMKNRVPTKIAMELMWLDRIVGMVNRGLKPFKRQSWLQRIFCKKKYYVDLLEDVAAALKPYEIEENDIIHKAMLYAPYKVGDRVGQMVFLRYPTVNIEVVEELTETDRGEGGFGSTGK